MSQSELVNKEYANFVYKSRYSRWLYDKERREVWDETVDRYIKFFSLRIPSRLRKKIAAELRMAIFNHEVMPSMRALMTAGPALDKDNCAGYNCSFLAVNDPRAFDEAMYISMCFHPDTEVRVKGGTKRISEIVPGDLVLSYDNTGFFYQPVLSVLENPTENTPKIELEMEDGSIVRCTEDHEFLTQRGYVKAIDLTETDDIIKESFFGKHHSQESINKISETKKKRKETTNANNSQA